MKKENSSPSMLASFPWFVNDCLTSIPSGLGFRRRVFRYPGQNPSAVLQALQRDQAGGDQRQGIIFAQLSVEGGHYKSPSFWFRSHPSGVLFMLENVRFDDLFHLICFALQEQLMATAALSE